MRRRRHDRSGAAERFLVRQGYLRTDTVRQPANLRWAAFGYLPPGRGSPVRLDFFGDELETIRDFDAATQRSGVAGPAGSSGRRIPAGRGIQGVRTGYRAALGRWPADTLYDSVTAGHMHPGMEHWLPLFHEMRC